MTNNNNKGVKMTNKTYKIEVVVSKARFRSDWEELYPINIDLRKESIFYFFPHYPEKYKTETIYGRICKKSEHKVPVKVKKLVKGFGRSGFANDREALTAAKEYYPKFKNFKGNIIFKIMFEGKFLGNYKYGNNKIKQRIKRLVPKTHQDTWAKVEIVGETKWLN
jgi:hypothetical protein